MRCLRRRRKSRGIRCLSLRMIMSFIVRIYSPVENVTKKSSAKAALTNLLTTLKCNSSRMATCSVVSEVPPLTFQPRDLWTPMPSCVTALPPSAKSSWASQMASWLGTSVPRDGWFAQANRASKIGYVWKKSKNVL